MHCLRAARLDMKWRVVNAHSTKYNALCSPYMRMQEEILDLCRTRGTSKKWTLGFITQRRVLGPMFELWCCSVLLREAEETRSRWKRRIERSQAWLWTYQSCLSFVSLCAIPRMNLPMIEVRLKLPKNVPSFRHCLVCFGRIRRGRGLSRMFCERRRVENERWTCKKQSGARLYIVQR